MLSQIMLVVFAASVVHTRHVVDTNLNRHSDQLTEVQQHGLSESNIFVLPEGYQSDLRVQHVLPKVNQLRDKSQVIDQNNSDNGEDHKLRTNAESKQTQTDNTNLNHSQKSVEENKVFGSETKITTSSEPFNVNDNQYKVKIIKTRRVDDRAAYNNRNGNIKPEGKKKHSADTLPDNKRNSLKKAISDALHLDPGKNINRQDDTYTVITPSNSAESSKATIGHQSYPNSNLNTQKGIYDIITQPTIEPSNQHRINPDRNVYQQKDIPSDTSQSSKELNRSDDNIYKQKEFITPTTPKTENRLYTNLPSKINNEVTSGWIWSDASTEMNDLEDRIAFTGDGCPTGKTKIQGSNMCVSVH